MNNIKNKLSEYIDQLNEEKKPKEHSLSKNSELDKLAETVRLVRSIREPAMPDSDFPQKVAIAVNKELSQVKPVGRIPFRKLIVRNPKRAWLSGISAVAAVIVMVFVLNYVLPIGNTNLVYAMEQAYQEVKAYHGILEIVETNAEGSSITQAKLEVWADKEGRYYVKELEGHQRDIVTVNNGQKKWQIRPDQKQINIFPAFPDPYRFVFELGNEVEEIKNSLETKVVGDEEVSGRKASILEVSPQGGVPYRIWIDKETKLPLQKQSGMYNALSYRVTYTEIDFNDAMPAELIAYTVPNGFKEMDKNPEQLVNNLIEAEEIAGFAPKIPQNMPVGYLRDSIAVTTDKNIIKLNYASQDNNSRVVILQGKSVGEFKPAAMAIHGKVGNNVAEIQSPVQDDLGVLAGGGAYAGVTNISSIRWQEDGFEYAIVGNISIEKLAPFVESLTKETVKIPSDSDVVLNKPKVEVPADLEVEKNNQKSVDAGSSPWMLEPAFVAQVFVGQKISPAGINGDYPIKYDDFKVVENNGKEAIIEVKGEKTPITKVYLKKLVRQDNTGIWTVIGYDPAS